MSAPQENALIIPDTEAVRETADLVALILKLAQEPECRTDGEEDWDLVADKLGWTREQLDDFRLGNSYLFELAENCVFADASPSAVIQPELLEPPAPSDQAITRSPSEEEVAAAVEFADRQLASGLNAMGLNQKEISVAQALQKFNKGHFKESMEMISSSVLVTALKIQSMQREVEDRLKFVREQIAELGIHMTGERRLWTKEEQSLSVQYTDLGALLNNIQDTWYKGAAYLAIVRARVQKANGEQDGSITQRRNKPGFRPTIVVDQEETPLDNQAST